MLVTLGRRCEDTISMRYSSISNRKTLPFDQVSFPLVREPQLSTLTKVREIQAFPILWFEETAEVANEDKIIFQIQNVEMK